MKRFYLSNIVKNRSFVKHLNVFLSAVMVGNLIAINGYTVSNSIRNRALSDHPSTTIVSRDSGKLDYFISEEKENNGANLGFPTYYKKTTENNVAYCLEHWIHAPDGDKYSRVRVEPDEGMHYVIFSEPNMGSELEDYYVKQMALNHYQGTLDYIESPVVEGEEYRNKAIEISRAATRFAEDVQNGVKESMVGNNKFTISSSNSKFALNGDYYLTDWFTVTSSSGLTGYNLTIENAPTGIQVLDKNNNVVTSMSMGSSDNKFKLRVPKANVKKAYDNINITAKANFNNNELVEYHPVDNNDIQKVLVVTSVQKKISRNTTVSIDEPKGSLKITKLGKNDVKLQGAKFKLEKGGVVVKDDLTTGANGEVVVNDLALGTYKLIEKTPPTGYIMTGQSQAGIEVEIKANEQTLQTVSNNIIQGRIGVRKVDAEMNNVGLEGAKFIVKDENGVIVDTLTTDENGNATSKLLDYGKYSLEEEASPKGYHLDNYVQEVDITENNKTYSYQVANRIYKGNVHIVKVNSDNEEAPVQGAGFDIIAKNVIGIDEGTVVEHIVTDENGFATSSDLRYGEYELKEVVVPSGFMPSGKVYALDILEDGKTYVKYIKNDPIKVKLRVLKTDADDNSVLSGVKFKIINKTTKEEVKFKEYINGKVVEKTEVQTNSNGEIITPQILPVGEYELVETNPLEGYKASNPIDFTINEATAIDYIETIGNIHTINVPNERIEGTLELSKVDVYTKEPISEVEFEVECISGFLNGQKFKITTSADGKVSLDSLDYGKYKITEIKTRENYVLNAEPTYFEIKNDADVIEVTLENKVKEGYIAVGKKDSESERPLEGVEFTIYNEDGEVVSTHTTDKEGKFKSDKLPYGKYKLKETKVLDSYIDNNLEMDFEIVNEGEIIEKEIKNESIKGDLSFKKVDSKTKDVLAGAKMKLVGKDDINKHIEIEFESLKEGNEFRVPIGRYDLTEEASPEGYIKSILPRKIEVNKDEKLEFNYENTKIPTSLGDILNKPTTGDDLFMYFVVSSVSFIGLMVLNRDKFMKTKFNKKNWEKYKRD